eukprot:TRINITY_DN14081_c0_g1_i3.p1 TRINITY_DN14081_c0_g1~~TRINITY_DN14081_c0_g1_i3.p1  ORF type:complete len:602 (-),score=55.88 TRINITY_DN14081_c0_g1_i3:224-1987(-)
MTLQSGSVSISLTEFIPKLKLGWDNYLSQDADHVEELKELGLLVDRGNLENASRILGCDAGLSRPAQVPIALFYGPPGSGKTYAMQILAQDANLKPYTLKVQGTELWETEFARALDQISALDDAVVFMDECDTIFSSRETLGGYGSVMAETKKGCIGTFLEWVNGLQSTPPKRLLMCLATNKLENLDEAIKSRAKVIKFRLPDPDQRRRWWAAHAPVLSPESHGKLATACVGLSFRDLSTIMEAMLMRVARELRAGQMKPEEDSPPALSDYLEQVTRFRAALRSEFNVGDYLRQLDLSGVPELTWSEYHADAKLKAQLQSIASATGQSIADAMRWKVYGANVRPSGPPIVLLHGPPGTGKTQGMKVVAAQTNRQLYVLSLKGLVVHSQIRELFSAILEELTCLRDAVVFVDECEEFFQSRISFEGYASVEVQHHKHLVTTFIQWADGLEKRGFQKSSVLLCLATNMKDALDPAILDRANIFLWWQLHAQHLAPAEHIQLARASKELSFRGLWAASEKTIEVQLQSSGRPPSCADYKECISSVKAKRRASPLDVARDTMDGASRVMNWFNAFVWTAQNIQYYVSRSRL